MEKLKISNLTIDVVRKDIKNIHLAVYPPNGRVRIAAPLRVTDDSIRLYAISKLSWIKRNQKKYAEQERIPVREYKERESHYFQGRRYLLNIIEHDDPPRVVLKSKKFMELYVRPGTTSDKCNAIVSRWYRTEMKKVIPDIIAKWEKKLNVEVNDWQIKQMKTMWGSCNIEKKRILLNLELAKKPDRCLEYVIVHEMIHLLERHHNECFLFYMEKHLLNWKQLKDELNKIPVSHVHWDY